MPTDRRSPAPTSASNRRSTQAERLEQLILAPVNGIYGLFSPVRGIVDTRTVGRLFGQIGVIVFIMSIGAFISISFATRSLEVAVASLANRLRSRGWMLIAAIMVLFSLLGSTMGFSVETFGFYALFIPLMAALGYDRLVTAAMIILGAMSGVMAATVNPFSIGVASGEAAVGIGDGIVLRLLLVGVADGHGHRLGAALCGPGAPRSRRIAGGLRRGCGEKKLRPSMKP